MTTNNLGLLVLGKDVEQAVWRTVHLAVERAVQDAVWRAVYRAVNEAVNGAVYRSRVTWTSSPKSTKHHSIKAFYKNVQQTRSAT